LRGALHTTQSICLTSGKSKIVRSLLFARAKCFAPSQKLAQAADGRTLRTLERLHVRKLAFDGTTHPD
jgi:hypothetical protein